MPDIQVQYRMHPAIAAFPSYYAYNNELKNGISALDRPSPSGFDWPHRDVPVAFIPVGDPR
jgi:regulator of nonsense transcripts 1